MIEKSPILYSDQFTETKGYLLESNQYLENLLQNQQQIVITGNLDDNFVIATSDNTYKLDLIKTRYTMLVTNPEDGTIYQELKDYLVLQKCLPKFQMIYQSLIQKEISEEEYKSKNINQILQQSCFSLKQILDNHKVSKKQLLHFLEYTNSIEISSQKWIFLSNNLLTHLMRNLLLYLNQNNLITSYFNYSNLIDIPMEQIFYLIAKKFKFTKDNNQYKIQQTSIIRFILLDLALTKNLYMKVQFDKLLQEAIAIYMPIGYQIPKNITQIGLNFLYLPKKNQMIAFDALKISNSITSRIKYMENYKKRYTYYEIVGIFYGVDQDIDKICFKYFRKYGEEYEIKLITKI